MIAFGLQRMLWQAWIGCRSIFPLYDFSFFEEKIADQRWLGALQSKLSFSWSYTAMNWAHGIDSGEKFCVDSPAMQIKALFGLTERGNQTILSQRLRLSWEFAPSRSADWMNAQVIGLSSLVMAQWRWQFVTTSSRNIQMRIESSRQWLLLIKDGR